MKKNLIEYDKFRDQLKFMQVRNLSKNLILDMLNVQVQHGHECGTMLHL